MGNFSYDQHPESVKLPAKILLTCKSTVAQFIMHLTWVNSET